MQPTAYSQPISPRPAQWIEIVRHRTAQVLRLLFLFLVSLLILAPLVWTVSTSLRSPAESFSVPPQWIPVHPVWSNYQAVFQTIPFGVQVFNSLTVCLGIVAGQLVTASLAGYAFGRLEFPGKNIFFWLILSTMMIPLQATMIPVFVLISKLRLADSLASLILPAFPTAFGTFLLRQYYLTIPKELEEAALLDGASQFQIFTKIYLPLIKPALAVLGVLAFNYHWNEFFRPLIFLSSTDKFTLPLGLVDLQGYMRTGSISVVLAGVVLSLIPVLIIFLVGQRYLIEGIVRGALKG